MSSGPAGRRFHILLVEDNPADIYLFRQALRDAGLNFELTIIENGADALKFARREGQYAANSAPDLAVLDLNLPKGGVPQRLRPCAKARISNVCRSSS
jgi:CheY-like chemotaxis protein